MLEIFMLRRLCGWLGDKAREKGHGPVPYQVLLVVLWFGGEISGAILGVVLAFMMDANAEGGLLGLFVIVFALSGVGVAVLTTYLIVNALADQRDSLAFEGDRVFNDSEGHFNRDGDDRFRGDGRTDPNKAPRSDDDRYTTE